MDLHIRPLGICNQSSYYSIDNLPDLRSCVLEFAKCAETLTVAASLKRANQVFSDGSVIEALQQSIHRLTIQSCTDKKSFRIMCSVARSLVCGGVVHELCIGHCTLSCDMIKELLEFGTTASKTSEAEVSDGWTRESCDDVADYLADSQENSSDLYDVALQPCSADILPFRSSVTCRSCSTHSALPQGTGIRALTVINFKSTSGSIDAVLGDVLPRLCGLQKLALIDLTEMNRERTLCLCRASQYLCTQIQSGQLSHVVIGGCLLPHDFLSMLLSALLCRCQYVLS